MMPDPPVPPPAAPPPPGAPETCFHHPDRETGRHCTRCGRPACGECLHQAAVGSQCWECIRAARPPTRERVRRSLSGRTIIATQVLIVANVVVFLLTNGINTNGNSLMLRLVEYGPYIGGKGEWWRLFTAGFVHFGITHILFNMLALYFIGMVLEPAIGPWRFSALYVASLLAGSLGALLLDPHSISGGASGAVFGIGAAATVIMWRRGIRFWDTGFGPLLLINLLFDYFIPNISIGAHIGGAIGGGLIGWAMIETAGRPYGKWVGYIASVAVAIVSVAASIAYAHARIA
jgi:membrane associated rhomboid family serine protease